MSIDLEDEPMIEELKFAIMFKVNDFHTYMKQKLLEKEKGRMEMEEERNRLKFEIESLQNNFSLQKHKDKLQIEFEQSRRKELEEELDDLQQVRKELHAALEQVTLLQEDRKKLKKEIKSLHQQLEDERALRRKLESDRTNDFEEQDQLNDFMQTLMKAQKVREIQVVLYCTLLKFYWDSITILSQPDIRLQQYCNRIPIESRSFTL
jgi:chromosome segregation ATPase